MRAAHVLGLVAATVVATLLLGRLGLPSPALFAGLAVGLVDALAARRAVRLPPRAGLAVVQYVRVLLVVLSLPVVLNVVFDVRAVGPAGGGAAGNPWTGVALVVVCGLAGPWLGRRAHLPAATLLGPLLLTAAFSLSGVTGGAQVPGLLQQVAYALIGLQIGLRFTRSSLAAVARVLPAAFALIVVGVAGSAGLGVALSRATGLPALDTYLATTPGGLYAVLAAAVGSGADATFVLSVQVLRLLVMLLAAPVLAKALSRNR